MARNVLIINGHPDPSKDRFCYALATAYAKGAAEAGCSIDRIDIAELDFPVLRDQNDFENGTPVASIRAAQQSIRDADHIAIVYPLWLGTMPALFKAFLEQTLRPGFAFAYEDAAWPKKGLTGKSARIIVTMGMPAFAYRWFYGAHSLKSLERNVLKFCGVRPVRETLIGMIDKMSDAKRTNWLSHVVSIGRKEN